MGRGIRVDVDKLKGVSQDSRDVQAGYLFAALPGTKVDGRDYINQAIENGATHILAPEGTVIEGKKAEGVELITHHNPRQALAHIAKRFYKVQPDYIVAVTGTNGKTSTVDFAQQLWKSKNLKSVSLGTLGVHGLDHPEQQKDLSAVSMTTPDAISLQAKLSELAKSGITHVAMEASSHGLDQYRLDGVEVKCAAFTNLSRDHLDYHRHMNDYFAAKTRLFSDVLDYGGSAVLNADVAEFDRLKQMVEGREGRVFSYGFEGEDLRISSIKALPQGQKLKLRIFGKSYDIILPLVGFFQTMNALCALGLVLAENPQDSKLRDDYVAALTKLKGAPGRLQAVDGHTKGAAIYVDYAHTPDALKNVLRALRAHTKGKLHCLFGCGGDRDEGKRLQMGMAAAQWADHVIVTDDNPRSEDPAKIRKAIMQGVPRAKEIEGRQDAIERAIADLKDGDGLVIAGKGHEQGQIIGDTVEPFDDVQKARAALKTIGG